MRNERGMILLASKQHHQIAGGADADRRERHRAVRARAAGAELEVFASPGATIGVIANPAPEASIRMPWIVRRLCPFGSLFASTRFHTPVTAWTP